MLLLFILDDVAVNIVVSTGDDGNGDGGGHWVFARGSCFCCRYSHCCWWCCYEHSNCQQPTIFNQSVIPFVPWTSAKGRDISTDDSWVEATKHYGSVGRLSIDHLRVTLVEHETADPRGVGVPFVLGLRPWWMGRSKLRTAAGRFLLVGHLELPGEEDKGNQGEPKGRTAHRFWQVSSCDFVLQEVDEEQMFFTPAGIC